MSQLALLVKNRHQYEIDGLKFNFRLQGNTRLGFSSEFKRNYRNNKLKNLNWYDEIKDYTNNKLLFSSLFTDDIHPKIYKIDELENDLYYYIKPIVGSCGERISIIKGLLLKNGIFVIEEEKYFIQKYIKPKLINGRKFDVRMYYFVIRYNGFFNSWYSLNGKIRLCEKKYIDGGELTNTSLLNDNIDKNILQGNLFNLLEIDRENIYKLMVKVNDLMRDTIINTKTDFVTMYGLDLIQDDNDKWYILEANGNPNWHNESDNEEMRYLKRNIYDEVLKILGMRFYHKNYKLDFWEQIE